MVWRRKSRPDSAETLLIERRGVIVAVRNVTAFLLQIQGNMRSVPHLISWLASGFSQTSSCTDKTRRRDCLPTR
jgi:hypothetical protein